MLEIVTTTEHTQTVQHLIDSVDRLNEVVFVCETPSNNYPVIELDTDKLLVHPDWSDGQPPFLFPSLTYSEDELLGVVFARLSNFEVARSYSISTDLTHMIAALEASINGTMMSTELTTSLLSFAKENEPLLAHYTQLQGEKDESLLITAYQTSLDNTKDSATSPFIAKHFASLLLDIGNPELSEKVLVEFPPKSNHTLALASYNALLASAIVRQSREFQPESATFRRAKEKFLEAFDLYQKLEMPINAGLVIMESGEWCDMMLDFQNATKHFSKAISLFKQESQLDLYITALIKKADMLYHWSKHGSPQYFKQAINAYQEAQKHLTKENAPWEYAHIQLQLAQLYAEIPSDDKERALWAAFSASAFKESIEVYNKVHYPYEYASACHNYATALSYYPDGKLRSNFQQANDYFEEALTIRTASTYPVERALTLINQLEVLWMVKFEDFKEEQKHYDMMRTKASEVLSLTQDPKLIETAKKQLNQLASMAVIS